MCRGCDGWKESGLDKRDFQHSKDGPEEIPFKSLKKNSKRWCKGKEGREHKFESFVWHSYKYIDSYGKERVRETYKWRCKGCGKIEWSYPKPPVGKHEHCYCKTEIVDRRWKHAQEIFEKCCVCGSKGRSYKFYEK